MRGAPMDPREYAKDIAAGAGPRRGDPVAEWIKRRRDEYSENSIVWGVMDNLLDDYREHADTGTPLSEDVHGPFAPGEER